jgi:FixJ family two-component response regulator
MSEHKPTVFIVDDDEVVRDTIAQLAEAVDLKAKTFSSAQEFLDSNAPEEPGCVILDVRMPGMSGIQLQTRLRNQNIRIPIIFVTGHGDVPMAAQAFKNGAVDFIEKPFRNQDLLDQIQEALAQDTLFRQKQAVQKTARDKLVLLTQREQEVLDLVKAGKANKVIAHELGLSQRTIEVHRAGIMEKMQADSLAELITLANKANHIEQYAIRHCPAM